MRCGSSSRRPSRSSAQPGRASCASTPDAPSRVTRIDSAIARVLPAVPRPVVRRLSAPYIAGPALDDAVRVVRRLNAEGKMATIDVLGEEVARASEATEIRSAYHRALERIEADGLDANVSVKLTGLGLELDEELARLNLEAVVA